MASLIFTSGACLLLISLLALPVINGITLSSYDKPANTKFPMTLNKTETSIMKHTFNATLGNAERQKRLLPYTTFYLVGDQERNYLTNTYKEPAKATTYDQFHNTYNELTANNYQPKYVSQQPQQQIQETLSITPFLRNNALTSPLVPIRNSNIVLIPNKVSYTRHQSATKPNYSEIYDKLSQLKLQNKQPYMYSKPQNYITIPKPPKQIQYIPVNQAYFPVKTIPYYEHIPVTSYNEYTPQTQTYHDLRAPHQDHVRPITEEDQNQYVQDQKYYTEIRKQPIQIIINEHPNNPPKQYKMFAPFLDLTKPRKPIIPKTVTYQVTPENVETYNPAYTKSATEIYPPNYNHPIYATVTPKYNQTQNYKYPLALNNNSLTSILKRLQDSNTLPKTLTPDNIDNSIRTLVRILGYIKKGQKQSFISPIVVADESIEYEEDNEAGVDLGGSNVNPDDVSSEMYPENTPEGGTPGKPGIDYPALYTIPKTSFNCKTQRYKGFFGDPDTHCQVWHYCDLNGGQASFLCPNGTIFSQVALTCDWWYNVKCSNTAQLYVLNERLYKYILPLSPKFPEDYSGPLVDRYIALKFKEMEEKMAKEKLNQSDTPSSEEVDDDDADELDKKNKSEGHFNERTGGPK